MRKALLSVLLALILILMILFMKNGLKIGGFHIYGFGDINAENANLTDAISKANSQSDSYTSALSKLNSDVEVLATAKKDYLDAIAQNTESDIRLATQTKTYTIEYLWSRVGNHATSQGVTLKMQVASSTLQNQDYRNLNFTAQGAYLAISQFMYEIENDANLDFTIDNFHMQKSSGDENILEATFVVKDVKIQREKTTTISPTTNSENEENLDDETSNETENDSNDSVERFEEATNVKNIEDSLPQ